MLRHQCCTHIAELLSMSSLSHAAPCRDSCAIEAPLQNRTPQHGLPFYCATFHFMLSLPQKKEKPICSPHSSDLPRQLLPISLHKLINQTLGSTAEQCEIKIAPLDGERASRSDRENMGSGKRGLISLSCPSVRAGIQFNSNSILNLSSSLKKGGKTAVLIQSDMTYLHEGI